MTGEALTLPEAFSERHTEALPKTSPPMGYSNLQPNSPLKLVADGPMRTTVLRVRGEFNGFNVNGSAFHVGGGIFLTAAHNFYWRKEQWSDCRAASIFSNGNWFPLRQWGVFDGYQKRADPTLDVAICSAPDLSGTMAYFPMADARRETRRKPAKVVGFPSERSYDGTRLYFAEGLTWLDTSKHFFTHKASTLEGDSGGPLLNSGDLAIGIHTTGHTDNRAVALWDDFITLVNGAIRSGVVPGAAN